MSLQDMIDLAKETFNDLIQDTIDEYMSLVDSEIDESNQRREYINNELQSAGDQAIDDLADFVANNVATMASENEARASEMVE